MKEKIIVQNRNKCSYEQEGIQELRVSGEDFSRKKNEFRKLSLEQLKQIVDWRRDEYVKHWEYKKLSKIRLKKVLGKTLKLLKNLFLL